MDFRLTDRVVLSTTPGSCDGRDALSQPLTLRNDIILPNRIAKAATSEHLADHRGARPTSSSPPTGRWRYPAQDY